MNAHCKKKSDNCATKHTIKGNSTFFLSCFFHFFYFFFMFFCRKENMPSTSTIPNVQSVKAIFVVSVYFFIIFSIALHACIWFHFLLLFFTIFFFFLFRYHFGQCEFIVMSERMKYNGKMH